MEGRCGEMEERRVKMGRRQCENEGDGRGKDEDEREKGEDGKEMM